MRKLILAATAALAFAAVSGVSQAGPLIIATSVTPKCAGMANSLTTVSVTLNTTTMNFYGASLYYHFKPASGPTQILPTPSGSGNPVALFVAPGTYNLQIAPQSTPLISSSTSSAVYPVAIPSNIYGVMGGKKMCTAVIGPVMKAPDLVKKAHQ